jgi:hypothetical protein
MRKFVSLFVVLALVCCANSLSAQELNQNFAHSLGVGNSAQSYEHRIDLPEKWAAEGKFFIGRALTLDGKLVIEREELTKTYYYVKVRLPKATLWFAKGSIDITLKAGTAAAIVPVLAAPTGLKVSGESYLTCRSCNGSGHIVSNGPNNTPVYKICYTCNGSGRERCTFCNGSGHVTVPSIIPE